MSFDNYFSDQLSSALFVSIPLEQGNVFRLLCQFVVYFQQLCLNPFGTGQCLSTINLTQHPFTGEQSQSLWNRAMSFDRGLG